MKSVGDINGPPGPDASGGFIGQFSGTFIGPLTDGNVPLERLILFNSSKSFFFVPPS